MEDLPLGRIAALVPEFAVKDLPLGRTLMMMMYNNSKYYVNEKGDNFKYGFYNKYIILDIMFSKKVKIFFKEKICLYFKNIIISVLPKSRSFTANSVTKAAILPKGRSSIANSGT